MVKLYETGAYLLDGEKLIPDDGSAAGVVQVSKEEAAKETMAYSILEKHNTAKDML